MAWSRKFVAFAAFCGAALFGATGADAGRSFNSWTSVKNERHGFAIAYPTGVFEQKSPPTSEEGRVLVSKDGRAKLLVGAFPNADNHSLAEYREFLLTDEFAGAAIDYAPVRQRWFVLSGVRNGEIFYQRVSFTCGGRLINSWAMLYPESERKTYDRVVEAVARTYSPGAGRTGACD
ncbi:MAG: hypothetical protein ACT4OU_09465 [Hyphomicrobium sp.]